MMYVDDTIVGIATAFGIGGISIIRVSGAKAEEIMRRITTIAVKDIESHKLYYCKLLNNDEVVDECMAVLMKAPKTYTKEDVFELHCHGGYEASLQAVKIILANGARLSEPGEFTKRAFLNGRIDISQAEAVMSMIHANGESALKSAAKQLSGKQSELLNECKETIIESLSGIEASVDFPDEIDEKEAVGEILPKLKDISHKLEATINERAARIIREGINVVLCGNPNAGKSTLFNTILNKDMAIVTDIPGTTRDLIHENIYIDGVLVKITDTAGMRDTNDKVEAIGVERAKNAISYADIVLYLIDGSAKITDDDLEFIKNIDKETNAIVITKNDLDMKIDIDFIKNNIHYAKILYCSAVNRYGVNSIIDFIKSKLSIPNTFIFTHERHLQCVKKAKQFIDEAIHYNDYDPIDMIAVSLKEALFSLGEITGESLQEDLIDNIFSKFCVGK